MKFKAGDKILCLEKGLNVHLTEGEVYTVKEAFYVNDTKKESSFLVLEEVLSKYYSFRFKLLSRKELI